MNQPDFLSAKTVSDDYLAALRADLEQADILRFVVAYVADSGTRAIGLKLLAGALQHHASLGVASLSCNRPNKYGSANTTVSRRFRAPLT